MERWSRARVDDLAPDDQVRKAGRKLATPTPWSEVGMQQTLLWGRCQGSGKNPYHVAIDLAGPSYKCSCPSRKFPCKHCVALLYLWSDGHVGEAGLADFAAEWSPRREARAAVRPENAEPRTPEQEAKAREQAELRAEQREQRVDEGVAELERFLTDQVRDGLAHGTARREQQLRRMAQRMVDAQAPGLATRLLDLAEIGDDRPDWPSLLLTGIGRLHLLGRAWQRRNQLPDDLLATVREHLGFTIRQEDVLSSQPGVPDRWAVLGMSEADEEQVSVRRVWLWGRTSERFALVLFFAPRGRAMEANLYPGTELDATLHFYPGRAGLRAVVAPGAGPEQPLAALHMSGESLTEARGRWRRAVASDPWLERWPVFATGRIGVSPSGDALVSGDDALALVGVREDVRSLAVASQGRQVTVFGELSSEGLRPLAVLSHGEVLR